MKKLWLLAIPALAAAIVFYHAWEHWLAYWTGSYDTPGVAHHYNFFSGSGSDLSELTIAVSVASSAIVVYRKHNCGVRGCWRIGRHEFTDPDGHITHVLCRKHHPLHPGKKAVTARHIREQYHLYLGDRPGRGLCGTG